MGGLRQCSRCAYLTVEVNEQGERAGCPVCGWRDGPTEAGGSAEASVAAVRPVGGSALQPEIPQGERTPSDT